jgi:hypothetical protein
MYRFVFRTKPRPIIHVQAALEHNKHVIFLYDKKLYLTAKQFRRFFVLVANSLSTPPLPTELFSHPLIREFQDLLIRVNPGQFILDIKAKRIYLDPKLKLMLPGILDPHTMAVIRQLFYMEHKINNRKYFQQMWKLISDIIKFFRF